MKVLISILILNSLIFSQALIHPKLPADQITGFHFINEDELILINSGGSIYKSYDGGINWELKKHFQGQSLVSIDFLNESTGFVLPAKPPNFSTLGIIYTTDAGESWEVQSLDISRIYDFLPVTETVSLKATWDGEIQRLDNFYNHWESVYSLPTFTINDPEFGEYEVSYGNIQKFQKISENDIIALGSNSIAESYGIIDDSLSFLLKSNDTGLTWDTLWIGLKSDILDINFFNTDLGWMSDGRFLYRSNNGGKTWDTVDPGISTIIIDNLDVISENVLFATVDLGRKLLKTIDGGQNWEVINLSNSLYGNINFKNEDYGFFFGYSLQKTENGGADFQIVHSSVEDHLNDMKFWDKQTGYAAGYDGVYKTVDGGISWNQKFKTDNSNSGQIAIVNDTDVWYLKYDSLFQSRDKGESWESFSLSTKSQKYGGISFYDDDLGIIYCVSEEDDPGSRIYSIKYHYVTINGGKNWEQIIVDTMFQDFMFEKVMFTDPQHLFAIGYEGFWLSRDTAKTWQELISGNYISNPYSFDFYDSLLGIVGSNYHQSFVTIDGGKNWKTFSKPIGYHSTGCKILGPNYANDFMRVLEIGRGGALFNYYFNESGDVINARQIDTYTGQDLTSIEMYVEDLFPNIWIGSTGFNILYREFEKLPTNVRSNISLIPKEPFLSQNYPNPFNPSTTIKYYITKNEKRKTINVKLVVYDILGKEVSVLVNENQKPGNYEVTFEANGLSSGIYFYSISAGNFHQTKKMILLR